MAPAFDPQSRPRRRPGLRRFPGLGPVLLAILPVLAAIWTIPGFVTQDGPAHLYNAQIIAASLRPDSPFGEVYRVEWSPVPNWAGHAVLVGLLQVVPAWVADRLMLTLTLVGFSGSVLWLRRRVAGRRGMALAAPMSVLLGLNVAWLLGFQSFLLGACLFPITLGVWWAGRERMGPGRSLTLAVLITLGYFCHLVSLGLTAIGLVVLAIADPGPGRARRLAWTFAGLSPLPFLAVLYLRLMQGGGGGGFAPTWDILKDPTSLASWGAQLGWVDPLTLASKTTLPFSDARSPRFGLLVPTLWFGLALLLFAVGSLRRPEPRPGLEAPAKERRGWALLAALLIGGGVVGPDSFGSSHGDYLPQRLFLLGLAAIVPYLDLGPRRWANRIGGLALMAALVLQSAFVWDYALRSDRTAGLLADARPFVGRGMRIGTLLVDIRPRFRANPLLHADNLLGVDTGNVVWNNYEAIIYFFPVKRIEPGEGPDAGDLERVAILDDPADRAERLGRWRGILERHHDRIDALVAWGSDPELDAEVFRWFEPRVAIGPVRVFRRLGLDPATTPGVPP